MYPAQTSDAEMLWRLHEYISVDYSAAMTKGEITDAPG